MRKSTTIAATLAFILAGAVCAFGSGTATLKTREGKAYASVQADGKNVFPSVALGGRMTLQGWSLSEGKKRNPEFMEGDVIPSGTRTYYMVACEPSDFPENPTLHDAKNHSYVYIVGDSRTGGMRVNARELERTRFVCKGGMGYDWLVSDGYRVLVERIKKDPNEKNRKKAVVFALGVNDMQNVSKYVAFYKAKAAELKRLGCDLYFSSITPFCVAGRQNWYRTKDDKNPKYTEKRTQALKKTFNKTMRKELEGTYGYIYSDAYLTRTGWPTWDRTSQMADNLHYPANISRKHLNFILRSVG